MFDWLPEMFYGIVNSITYLMQLLMDCFEIAVGLQTVDYNGDTSVTLLDVVFGDAMLQRVYWGMAIIGVGLCFFFTILAVIKKMFDYSDQMKASLGEILTQTLKSILLICSMSLILSMTLFFSQSLLNAMNLAFYANTAQATTEKPKTYSQKEYATMARVLDTIGNYGLNNAAGSRYNINSCYNSIRLELQSLVDMGTFSVSYETPDLLSNSSHYWQESLQQIVNAAPDLSSDMPMDLYNASLSDAILNTMEQINTNDNFKPLEKYASSKSASGDQPKLDRIILLLGTFEAAYNDKYNYEGASLTDPVRLPYYTGEKDLYNADDMWEAFDLWDYKFFSSTFLGVALLINMLGIILNAIARIINLAILYVAAPPFIAMAPLDGGGKFKQWTTAFIIQCFGVFGSVLGMNMLVVMIPIIMNSHLRISSNAFVDLFVKTVIIWAFVKAVKKSSSLITSILAGNAAWQSADAGNISQSAGQLTGFLATATGLNLAKKGAKMVAAGAWNETKQKLHDKFMVDKGSIVDSPGQGSGNLSTPQKAAGGQQDGGGGAGSAVGRAAIGAALGGSSAGGSSSGASGSHSGGGGQQSGGNAPQKAGGGESDRGSGGGSNDARDSSSGVGDRQSGGNDPQRASGGESDSGVAGSINDVRDSDFSVGGERPSDGNDPQKASGGELDSRVAGSINDVRDSDSSVGGERSSGGNDPQKAGGGESDSGSGGSINDVRGSNASGGERPSGVSDPQRAGAGSHPSGGNASQRAGVGGHSSGGDHLQKAGSGERDSGVGSTNGVHDSDSSMGARPSGGNAPQRAGVEGHPSGGDHLQKAGSGDRDSGVGSINDVRDSDSSMGDRLSGGNDPQRVSEGESDSGVSGGSIRDVRDSDFGSGGNPGGGEDPQKASVGEQDSGVEGIHDVRDSDFSGGERQSSGNDPQRTSIGESDSSMVGSINDVRDSNASSGNRPGGGNNVQRTGSGIQNSGGAQNSSGPRNSGGARNSNLGGQQPVRRKAMMPPPTRRLR